MYSDYRVARITIRLKHNLGQCQVANRGYGTIVDKDKFKRQRSVMRRLFLPCRGVHSLLRPGLAPKRITANSLGGSASKIM